MRAKSVRNFTKYSMSFLSVDEVAEALPVISTIVPMRVASPIHMIMEKSYVDLAAATEEYFYKSQS